MKREDYAVMVLWVLLILGLLLGVRYGVVAALTTAVGEILVALIGGAFLLLGAMWTHALTQAREQRLEQQRERQRNYARLLEHIDKVIRHPGKPSDSFSKVHLESWVVGSEDVILRTKELLKAAGEEERKKALKSLLVSMRKDAGLPTVKNIEPELIFPEREKSFS